MHKAVPLAVVVILLSGCASGAATDGASSTAAPTSLPSFAIPPGTASPSAAPSAGSSTSPSASGAAVPSLPTDADWSLVNAGLERPGAQTAFDAAADGSTVVASVLTEDTVGDFDAGTVYSTDSGASWQWGGVVADVGSTFPEGVLLEAEGAVIVGSNQVEGPNGIASHAFIALAPSPGFVPVPVDLPTQFDGRGVQLQDIVSVDGTWVVAGYVAGKPDDEGKQHPAGVLWRSPDRGRTWSRQEIVVADAVDVVVKELVIAPDGSWNVIGQVSEGNIITQYDALWLRSTDEGRSFARMGVKGLTSDFDQGATRIVFSADGSVAMLGWTELSEDHGQVSALWLKVPGHDMSPVAAGALKIDGSTTTGEFIDGIMWNQEQLVAWGSPDASYPMPDAEFWNLTGGQLMPTATLPGDGTPLDVSRILAIGDTLLGFGFSGADIDQADVGVWTAPFAAS